MSPINHHVTGLEYWRSLEQLAETPEVAEFLDKEFPGYDADTIAATSRRGFMKLMGAAMALAGVTLTGCRRWPKEELAPYSSARAASRPACAEHYATSYELNGVGTGLLVTSYDGRPIKIEGSPDHPSSYTVKGHYGSADAFAQATLLEMYDPMRRPPDVQAPLIDRREGPSQPSPRHMGNVRQGQAADRRRVCHPERSHVQPERFGPVSRCSRLFPTSNGSNTSRFPR